jgi:hypothetical protein
MIKLRMMMWAGHVGCMVGIKVHKKFQSGNLQGTDHLKDLGIGGRKY